MLPFPLRYTYGNSDVSANSNIGDLFGNDEYVYSENVVGWRYPIINQSEIAKMAI